MLGEYPAIDTSSLSWVRSQLRTYEDMVAKPAVLRLDAIDFHFEVLDKRYYVHIDECP